MKLSLNLPIRNDASLALLEIDEAEKRRTQRAIEAANERRRPVVVTGKGMLKLFGAIVLASAFIAYLLFAGPILEWARSVLQ